MEIVHKNSSAVKIIRRIPTEDGWIGLEQEETIVNKHQTDADGRAVFDKARFVTMNLVKLDADGRVVQRLPLPHFSDMSDLTHDHILVLLDSENAQFLRKADLSVAASCKSKSFAPGYKYIVNGRLMEYRTIRAYGSLYNWKETELDIELPEEVLASAKQYAEECEERQRTLHAEHPSYDFTDRRLLGMVNADGEIVDFEKFDEYVCLWLLTCSGAEKNACCSLCGEPVTDGYATVDLSKHICRQCYDTFAHALRFITSRNLSEPDNGEKARFRERIQRSKERYAYSTGDFDRFCSVVDGDLNILVERKLKNGVTDTWYWRPLCVDSFGDWLKRFREGMVGPVSEIVINVLTDDETSDHCMELVIRPGQTEFRAYPPIESAGEEAYERFRDALPNYKNSALEENPFAPVFTNFEIVPLWSMTTAADHRQTIVTLFDCFAEAVYEQGGRSLFFVKTGFDGDALGYGYRINMDENGVRMNHILRKHIGNSTTAVILANGIGAVVISRFGYAAVGGNHGLTEAVRSRCGGTQKFVKNYYIFYHPDMSEFYKRKRAVVTWATTSEAFPDGLYDIFHAHRFSLDNRQYIADNTVCGCFYCRKNSSRSKARSVAISSLSLSDSSISSSWKFITRYSSGMFSRLPS